MSSAFTVNTFLNYTGILSKHYMPHFLNKHGFGYPNPFFTYIKTVKSVSALSIS